MDSPQEVIDRAVTKSLGRTTAAVARAILAALDAAGYAVVPKRGCRNGQALERINGGAPSATPTGFSFAASMLTGLAWMLAAPFMLSHLDPKP